MKCAPGLPAFLAYLIGAAFCGGMLMYLLFRRWRLDGPRASIVFSGVLVVAWLVGLVLSSEDAHQQRLAREELAATNARQGAVTEQLAESQRQLASVTDCQRSLVTALQEQHAAFLQAWARDDESTRGLLAQAVIDNPVPQC